MLRSRLVRRCPRRPQVQSLTLRLYSVCKRYRIRPPGCGLSLTRHQMGFSAEDVQQALRATNFNYEAACAWLLGDRDGAAAAAAGEDQGDEEEEGASLSWLLSATSASLLTRQ